MGRACLACRVVPGRLFLFLGERSFGFDAWPKAVVVSVYTNQAPRISGGIFHSTFGGARHGIDRARDRAGGWSSISNVPGHKVHFFLLQQQQHQEEADTTPVRTTTRNTTTRNTCLLHTRDLPLLVVEIVIHTWQYRVHVYHRCIGTTTRVLRQDVHVYCSKPVLVQYAVQYTYAVRYMYSSTGSTTRRIDLYMCTLHPV